MRIEKDALGELPIPIEALWGIHTARAVENFPVSGQKMNPRIIHAYGEVKLACCRVNTSLGFLQEPLSSAIISAAKEMSEGILDDSIRVDALQGGAGTSTNLNVCEVLANRSLILLGKEPGDYATCDPIAHINMHQSTNDTFPTALKIACLRALIELEQAITGLLMTAQSKERDFSHIVKVGRTELMDAVPITLGRTFGAWAEALSRDRWRIYKARERLRVVNLGGTAVGTGLGAPRDYIFQVVEILREITGLPLARSENLVDGTQNQDVFVETMGMLKAHCANLVKISGDLRLLAMGPDAGLHEIELPPLQSGSSIMPAKVNPVIPEMMTQAAFLVFGLETALSLACSSGQLELNAFLPLIAHSLLTSLDLMIAVNHLANHKCLAGITANEDRCRALAASSAALATVLVPLVGYQQATAVSLLMRREHLTLEQAAWQVAKIPRETIEKLISPDNLNSLGFNFSDKSL